MSKNKTNWFVFSGRSSSGISTTLAELAKQGFRTISEAARTYINEQLGKGLTIQEIRKDEASFQRAVLKKKIEIENNLPKEELILFDRAIPDSVPYYEVNGIDPQEALAVCEPGLYKKIFFLEPVNYIKDYARTESEETLNKLTARLKQTYLDLGYQVVAIPALSVEERVKLIRSQMELT